jgi:hypothetical protein
MNNRLYIWAEENDKIDETQASFRNRYFTINNSFTLQALVQKYLSKSEGRLYVHILYVDFAKAFVNISHSHLFNSLLKRVLVANLYVYYKVCLKTKR